MNAANNMNMPNNLVKGPNQMWILYALSGLFVFVIVLMLQNKQLDFSWLDFRPKNTIQKLNSYRFWKPEGLFTNLTIKPEERVPDFTDNSYSMSIECMLIESRQFHSVEGPYRHIVHRGSNELATTTIGGMIISGCAANNAFDTPLPPFGLPKRMNPGIFLDPNINDLIVFVDTMYGGEPLRESLRIVDLPLKIPFYLFIIMNNNVLEVYLNCRLEATKILQGVAKHVENDWYGIAGSANAQAQIQNMYVWRSPLTSEQIRPQCPAPLVFGQTRPSCEGADTAVPAKSSKTATIDLGYGKSISACPSK